jgi:hypothetical protein
LSVEATDGIKDNRTTSQRMGVLMAGLRILGIALAAIAVATWTTQLQAQQSLRPRAAPQKLTLEQLRALPSSDHVIVKFREGSGIRYADGRLISPPSLETASFEAALRRIGLALADMDRLFARPEDDLDREREQGQQRSGGQLADLKLYYLIEVPAGLNAAEVANALNALDVVEFAEPQRPPAPPPVDILPTTPTLTAQQGYKAAAPQGINVPTDDEIPGSGGGLWRYADIEYSWQFDHEDLELGWRDRATALGFVSPIILVPPKCTPTDPFSDTDHGTAVLGVISAKPNEYGMTGIAPTANPIVIASNCSAKTGGNSVARSVNYVAGQGIRHILIEAQEAQACGLGSGPVEAMQAEYDAIAQATALGFVVVEAAGNGAVNLDAPNCSNLFNAQFRDSGAIIVGAGVSTDRSRSATSSFGSRVNVQGWGDTVATTGYGRSKAAFIPFSLFDPGDIRQRYTSGFNGTSSASAIVMGAVLSIQGALRLCAVPPLNSATMRALLIETGTPQAAGAMIGPLPNVRAALASRSDVRACRATMAVSGGDFTFSGRQGGPFAGSARTVTSSVDKLAFTVTPPAEFSVNPTGGFADTAGETVLVVPNGGALLFPPGDWGPFAITFTNLTNGLGTTTRMATLSIRPINDDFNSAIVALADHVASGSNINATRTRRASPRW